MKFTNVMLLLSLGGADAFVHHLCHLSDLQVLRSETLDGFGMLRESTKLSVSLHDTDIAYSRKTQIRRNNLLIQDNESLMSEMEVRPKKATDNTLELHPKSGIEKVKIKRAVSKKKHRGIFQGEMTYHAALDVLKAYHAENGNLVIPRRYVVPETDDYPKKWHGVALDRSIYNMNWWTLHVKSRPERVSELNELGFVWERLQPEWNLVLEGIITYYSIHGHIKIPSAYIVPFDDDIWPKATWGIHLGNCVHRIRTRHDFLRDEETSYSRRKQLDGLGFVWDVSENAFHTFVEALKVYQKLEKKNNPKKSQIGQVLRVPSTFTVPSGMEHGWPQALWGYPLGVKCTAVRQKQLYLKNNPERARILEDIGFNWCGNSTLGWLQVVHAAAIYSKLHGKTLDVPAKFIVPSPPETNQDSTSLSMGEAWPWPEKLWGFPLGQRLKDIRLKNAYMSGASGSLRRAQLDALGFNWNPKRGRRRRQIVANLDS